MLFQRRGRLKPGVTLFDELPIAAPPIWHKHTAEAIKTASLLSNLNYVTQLMRQLGSQIFPGIFKRV